MNIWFFIILIVAFAIVIGPITMLRPNPAQRRKEQLRSHARAQGLHFSMRRLPALKTDMEPPPLMPVYYLLSGSKSRDVPEWIIMRTSYAHEGNFYLEWDWQTDVRPSEAVCDLLKRYIPTLPASVPAITHGNLGICVFWSEKEDTETLDLLIAMVNRLQQEISPSQV